MDYHFDWDPVKAAENERKHGVTFFRASTVFLDRRAMSLCDTGHSEYEDRWITLGVDYTASLLAIVHTFDVESLGNAKVRIISARRATRAEASHYEMG